jgi:hypothetical protein
MANLQFETSIVGVERVKAALASLETRFQRLNMSLLKANNLANKVSRRVDPMARTMAQEETKLSVAKMKEETKLAVAAKREQERTHRDNLRRIRTENRERERAEARIGRMRTQMIKSTASNTMGDIKSAATYGTAGAVGLFAAAMRDMINKKAITAGIANEMKTPDEKRSLGQLQEDITAQFEGIAKETGMSFEEIATGFRAAIGVAGRGKLFQGFMPDIARISDYGNANVSDMGKAAGHIVAMLASKGITNEDELRNKTYNALIQMTEQAKKGNINMDDFSRTMAVITAASGQFSGDPIKNLLQMSGMAQFAVETGGAKGPEEAGTAALRLSADLINAADTIKEKYGVNVFGEDGNLALSPAQMAEAMIVATKGNQTELGKIFQGESIKIVRPLLQAFLAGGGGEAGRKALRTKMAGMENMPWNQRSILEGSGFRANQPDRELSKAWSNFVDQATPSLKTFLDEMLPLLPKFTKALTSLANIFMFFAEKSGATSSPLALAAWLGGASLMKNIAGTGINFGANYMLSKLVSSKATGFMSASSARAASTAAAAALGNAGSGAAAASAARGAGQAGFATVGAMGGIAAGVLSAGVGLYIGKEIANSFWDEVQARSDKILMSSVNASVLAGGNNLTDKKAALAQISAQLNYAKNEKGSWSGMLGDFYEGASGRLSNLLGYTDGPIRISSEENIKQLEAAKADLEASIKKQQADMEAAKASEQLKATTQRASAAMSSLVDATDKVKERFGNLTQNPVPISDKSRGGR